MIFQDYQHFREIITLALDVCKKNNKTKDKESEVKYITKYELFMFFSEFMVLIFRQIT